jgi:hypothetical protein
MLATLWHATGYCQPLASSSTSLALSLIFGNALEHILDGMIPHSILQQGYPVTLQLGKDQFCGNNKDRHFLVRGLMVLLRTLMSSLKESFAPWSLT